MRSIWCGCKVSQAFQSKPQSFDGEPNKKICFLKKKIYEIRRTATKALMRELGDILTRTSSPKQRERHILPKTLPRVTGPNKAALKLLVLVSRLLVLYNLRRNLIQSVYSWNLDPGSEKKCCIVQGRV